VQFRILAPRVSRSDHKSPLSSFMDGVPTLRQPRVSTNMAGACVGRLSLTQPATSKLHDHAPSVVLRLPF
jgi:hypothetical protein